MVRAAYLIVQDFPGEPLVIQDIGPWDKHPTVTNDAEAIVMELSRASYLTDSRRLFYIDSWGQKDEIVHRAGCFIGFRPSPR